MATVKTLDSAVNILQSLLWQHNDAPKLTALVAAKQEWYDTNLDAAVQDWVRDVFDLRTANEFGLRVWSIVLGLPLQVVLPATNKPNFGFGTFNRNFNRGNFASASGAQSALSAREARQLLQLRYFQLVTRPTTLDINRMLAFVFKGQGSVFVNDSLDMRFVTYTFGFQPGTQFIELCSYYDVLPRPAAVGVRIIVQGRPVFGFGPYNKPFNVAPFAGN